MANSAKWDIVVVGGANTDYLVRGERLPRPGETVQGHTFHEGPGGKGANQAVAAARLGARVAFVARLGRDARGDVLVGQLRDEGVDPTWIMRDSVAPTGIALIVVDEHGEKQIATSAGANEQFAPSDVNQAADALRNTRVMLSQLEVPVASVTAAFRMAKQSGAITVLDPAPPVPLDEELLQLLDFIRPNASEAEVLTGVKVTSRDTARKAALRLMGVGVGAVAVQAAEEGNLLVWKDGEQLFPKMKVNSVDATGAGDAFAAAFAVMLAEGRSLVEAGEFANAAAALATTVVGAQSGLPSRKAVLRLLKPPR